jgi:uncharacterized membrane protein (DUF4010 family)
MPPSTIALRLGVALGIGLLIGAERERRKAQGPGRVAAGIRTFSIISVLGAICSQFGGETLLVAALLVVGAFATVSYFRVNHKDPGLTTESALLLTLVLGALAMREPAIASPIAVVVAILLAARTQLHRFVSSVLTEEELHDALIFAAAVVVVLPLMPNRYLGPFGAINPRTIWKIVVLIMTVSAAGHVAVRSLGPRFGLPLAGLASGFASSVATIATMGARAKEQQSLAGPATAGAVLSTIATFIQLAVLLQATGPSVLWALRFPLAAAGVVALLYGVTFTLLALKQASPKSVPPGSVFNLKVTVFVTATITAVFLVSAIVNAKLGRRGLAIAAAAGGFGDAHSAAVAVASLVTSGKLSVNDSFIPILVAITTNTVTKIVLAVTGGTAGFAARVIPGLLLTITALWVALLI